MSVFERLESRRLFAVSVSIDGTVLHVAGPGDIALPFGNNYAGKWSVDAGQLDVLVAGALGTGANLNISAGAIFSVTNFVASTYTLDTAFYNKFSGNHARSQVPKVPCPRVAHPKSVGTSGT